MMTDYYDKAIKALQLSGMGEPIQQAYARSVRMLNKFYDKTPECISGDIETARDAERMEKLGVESAKAHARQINPHLKIIELSCKTSDGVSIWLDRLREGLISR